MHKRRGHSASGLLFTFWFLLMVCAIPQMRWETFNFDSENQTAWTQFQFINFTTFFALITVMSFLNFFPDKAPRSTTYTKAANPSPEMSSGVFNQIFFLWFDKTMWYGWRRPLTEKDIYDINPSETSRELVPPFDKYFYESVEKAKRCESKLISL